VRNLQGTRKIFVPTTSSDIPESKTPFVGESGLPLYQQILPPLLKRDIDSSSSDHPKIPLFFFREEPP